MKLKIEVSSWNNYPPLPHTHTSGSGGGGLIRLTRNNYSWVRNCSVGPLNTKKSCCLRKINLFGLHKTALCPGNLSGTLAGIFASRPKIYTCVPHLLLWIFLSSTKSRKASCQLLAKQNGS